MQHRWAKDLRKVDSKYYGEKTSRVRIRDIKQRMDSEWERGVGNYSIGEDVICEKFASLFEETGSVDMDNSLLTLLP